MRVGGLNANFDVLGFTIIALFIAVWAGSTIPYRYKSPDESRSHQPKDSPSAQHDLPRQG